MVSPHAVPQLVLDKLATEGLRADALLLCASTDIDRLGQYRPQWLAVARDRLMVVTEATPPAVLHSVRFDEISEIRCEPVIGSGLLQARVDGIYVDLLRYSNRMADRFSKVARKLDQLIKGEKVEFEPADLEAQEREGPLVINRAAVWSRIAGLTRPYAKAATIMFCLLLVGIALDLVAPQLTRILVDQVLPGSHEAAKQLQADPVRMDRQGLLLLQVVGILAVVQILRMGVNVINGRLGARVGASITADMRNRLVNHLQKLSVGYYDRQQVGSLVGRVAYDTEALHGLVNQITGGFLFQMIMLVGVAVMMFSINVQLATAALLPAPLVIAGSLVFWRYVYPRYYRFWDASSKQAGMLSGMLSGIRVVKAFAKEGHEQQRFENASGRLQSARLSVDQGVVTFNPFMGLLFQLGGWIVWYVGGRNVMHDTMTLGQLMAFFGYMWMFYGPLATLTQLTNWLTQFLTQVHRIFEILDTPAQITDAADAKRLPRLDGRITFERVSFGYDRHMPVLRDVTFDIPAGQMIGVVGRSGSGKTTVINLICRFYDVNDGRVLIDGLDVRKISTDDLRRQIGVVLQEPFLFRGSIYENLVYGKSTATPAEVITASKAGNCHDFILRSAHGYDTWVGERGAGLSGGERQRVSIARVVLADPRVLILDEATSSVDAESEAAIQAALGELVKGRTTIAIAHRLSTLRQADRILVVDQGRIAEDGRHDELVRADKFYAKLVRMQGVAAPSTVDELAQKDTEKKQSPETADFHPRWLTSDMAKIHLGGRGTLHVTVINDRIYSGVFAVRCFPVQQPSGYISLRYFNPEKRAVEVGIIEKLSDWPDDVQDLVRQSLLKRYLVHTVQAVKQARMLTGGFLELGVDTDLGPVTMVMRLQGDRAQDYGKGGKLLLDLDDNRYLIPDLEKLPERDRRLFTRYIYW